MSIDLHFTLWQLFGAFLVAIAVWLVPAAHVRTVFLTCLFLLGLQLLGCW